MLGVEVDEGLLLDVLHAASGLVQADFFLQGDDGASTAVGLDQGDLELRLPLEHVPVGPPVILVVRLYVYQFNPMGEVVFDLST